ncbi:ankyrin repeat domain-containing protein, partial [Photobacterium leiognathi]|uniref:ankyrin repeat domain-containing protein n=1 Tax=Photobacterium leiognathi TaxID=553611 RepID=UPI002982A9B0
MTTLFRDETEIGKHLFQLALEYNNANILQGLLLTEHLDDSARHRAVIDVLASRGNVSGLLYIFNKLGVDINSVNAETGSTALHFAAFYGQLNCVKALLEAPDIDVNKGNYEGQTPLYMAACNGHLNCVKALVKAPGIDVNQGNTMGTAALHAAAHQGHLNCVKALLEAPGID